MSIDDHNGHFYLKKSEKIARQENCVTQTRKTVYNFEKSGCLPSICDPMKNLFYHKLSRILWVSKLNC